MNTPETEIVRFSEKFDKPTAISSFISTNYLGFEERKSNEMSNATLRS